MPPSHLADISLESLRAFLRAPEGMHAEQERPVTLPLGIPSVDALLPEGGLPRGAVVEVSSARGLGRSTTLALAACASAQSLARRRSGDPRTVGAWCAFIDPWATLHASGALGSGVDLSRLLVVRPPLDALARVAIRVASSHAFSVVVIDTASLPGATPIALRAEPVIERDAGRAMSNGHMSNGHAPNGHMSNGHMSNGHAPNGHAPNGHAPNGNVSSSVNLDRWGTLIRRLALAVERADTTVLLLTDSLAHRAMPLPVAMRIELERTLSTVMLRIAKDRRGRITSPAPITFERVLPNETSTYRESATSTERGVGTELPSHAS